MDGFSDEWASHVPKAEEGLSKFLFHFIFLSISCPIPTWKVKGGSTPYQAWILQQQNLIGTAFIVFLSFSRRLVSFEGHREWGSKK